MKVLLTSDLDRTLIFSDRTKLENIEYVCIEQLDGKNMSYMSKNTLSYLTELFSTAEVIPVTTRSLKQYQRITVFQKELQPKYAIASNGGVVLCNGKIDEEWQKHIQFKMSQLPVSYDHVSSHFAESFNKPYVLRVHEVEDLFFVLIIEREKLEDTDYELFKQQLEANDWTCHLQGKKLYVLPRFLTKGAAVAYIKGLSTYDWHAAAGDSALDVSMLELANKYFIPQHAELAQTSSLDIMKESSSNFSDAFLKIVIDVVQNK